MRFCIAVFLILFPVFVLSTPADIIQLKDHLITNLIEENRGISGAQLTNDVEFAINLKIDGFLNLISAPATRKARDTNDLLLNEKSKLRFLILLQNYFPRASVEAKKFLSHVR